MSLTGGATDKEPSRRQKSAFVYFVEAASSGLIKIGVARNMAQRLAALQTGSPDKLTVVAVIRDKDPEALERILHNEYRADRSHGEWFRLSERLAAFIVRHGRTLAQDEADQRAATLKDWVARGVVAPVREWQSKRMNRKEKLARYKQARGIVD